MLQDTRPVGDPAPSPSVPYRQRCCVGQLRGQSLPGTSGQLCKHLAPSLQNLRWALSKCLHRVTGAPAMVNGFTGFTASEEEKNKAKRSPSTHHLLQGAVTR